MAFSAKLMNPTPWDAKVDWSAAIKLRIPAFGDAPLTMGQMDDFRGDKAGSENVRENLDWDGLFLEDSDRPYDNQALEALKRCRKAKKARYDSAIQRLRDTRAATGVHADEEALEETLRIHGFVTLREKIETLEEQIKLLEVRVKPEESAHKQVDPTRTVLVTDPPRQFPSVAAMEFFLDMNPEIKALHQAHKLREVEAITPANVETQ